MMRNKILPYSLFLCLLSGITFAEGPAPTPTGIPNSAKIGNSADAQKSVTITDAKTGRNAVPVTAQDQPTESKLNAQSSNANPGDEAGSKNQAGAAFPETGAPPNSANDTNQTPATPASTQGLDAQALLESGIKNYREKKFAEASQYFAQAARAKPSELAPLTNWGLAEAQLGHNYLALALLRRVLFLDPEYTTAEKAVAFISANLQVKEVPHEITWMENLHSRFLGPKSLATGFGLTAFFLFASGWLLISSFGVRKKAFKSETSMPAISAVGILLFCLFLMSAVWSILKIYDLNQPRATILKEKISLMSAPDSGSVSLLDLFGGLQVVIENHSSGDWLQVTYPGSVTGWVHGSDILIENEPLPATIFKN